MLKLWRVLCLLSIIVSLAALPACTKKKTKNDYGLDISETLRINIRTEPPSLDWSKSTDTTSALIQYNIMEGLTEYDFSGSEVDLKPALAESWESSNKAQVWTFKIRPQVKWTDGVDLTAQHFVDGWERLLRPSTASEYAYFLYSVKNARAYNEGKLKDFSKVGVKAVGDNQLQVELVQPKAYFPLLLTHHSTYPLRTDIVKKHGDNKWTRPENIVTLGAYKLKTWDHDKAIVLERNDTYYGEKAKTKYILAYMINELSTAMNLFDSGRLDAQNELPSREIGVLKSRPEYIEENFFGIYYYGFNTKKKPFDNLKVRKAFGHAIDRQQITSLLAGGQIPITGWLPKGMMGYEKELGLAFDTVKANQLLDAAGFKDRSTFPKITIGFNTNEDHQRIAENVQAQLKKNLGVEIELANEEWKTYLKTLQNDASPIFRLGWVADYPDPDNFLNLMTSFSENNHTNWGSSAFDKLIKAAVSETNKEKRRSLYAQAQKILVEAEVPVIPIYSMVNQFLISDRVKNYPVNKMRKFLYKDVELK